MTWHVISQLGPEDVFTPALGPEDHLLLVPFDAPGHKDAIRLDVADQLAGRGVEPPPPAFDLLRAAIAAYTADTRIPRQKRKDTPGAYDGWTRDIMLHLCVQDEAAWQNARADFERLLRFLTGDYWRITVRRAPGSYRPAPQRVPRSVTPLETNTVCLFSGGLDSFIGAVDELSRNGQVALVGHHAAGGGATSTSQTFALDVLRNRFTEARTPFFKFWVSPPKGPNRDSEITTRGRSILFLALGVAVASGLPNGRLIVPENGLISLNVPLTSSRLGSLSTRTTHPHLIALLRRVLRTLGLNVEVVLPYRFQTKGEMLAQCADAAVLTEGLGATMSCSHPGAGRYSGLRSPNFHCGYCLPCLIRRASIASVLTDPTRYAFPDARSLSTKRGADLRSLKLALNRYGRKPPRLPDLLVSGPLPGNDDELAAYLEVLKRGLDEVRRLVQSL